LTKVVVRRSVTVGTGLVVPIGVVRPLVVKPPRLRLQRETKNVTVCIAGIQYNEKREPLIIAASDRRISVFGGYFSDETSVKFGTLNHNWIVMFAGNPEHMKLVIDEVARALKKNKKNSYEQVVKVCQLTYLKQRKRLIETVVLPEYDLVTYQEYKALEKTDESLFRNVTDRIRKEEEEWNLLFAGFDDIPFAHIFVITGSGAVEYNDYKGVASIGSGSWAALLWLSYYGYRKGMELGQAAFGILSAKFFAQRARDVGEKTILTVMKPNTDWALILGDRDLITTKSAWESIYLKPKATTDELEKIIAAHLELYGSTTQ
jgi:ATP-dependent protease HslVU (ClpYQ) peptidase subunit